MSEMTKEEFIAGYCEKSKLTWDELKATQVALSCACGDSDCSGWAMVTNTPESVRDHNRLYGS